MENFKTEQAVPRRLTAHHKPPIPFPRHLVALLPIDLRPAEIRHQHPRLSRDVGAKVPGVDLGAEGLGGDLADMGDPSVFGAFLRANPAPLAPAA